MGRSTDRVKLSRTLSKLKYCITFPACNNLTKAESPVRLSVAAGFALIFYVELTLVYCLDS
ncbi:hypothetical protein [Leptospira noguchii]|uniref:hypothetical protein n=1 Tax=Leptospira noguchii TaxID=28182 RepID=UPI0012FAC769|nr:hypothetical protein [Leptospira noguchii]